MVLKADVDWSEIVETHQHTVVLSILAIGLPLDRAQDLANRTWARLLEQHADDKLAPLTFPGLAIRQARFLALDELRRDKREEAALETLEKSALPGQAEDPERRVLDKERLARAIEAITFCSPSSQRVFRAVYEQPGVPHAVIAERMGLSVQRVRQILCEVRRKVRIALAEDAS